MFDFAIASGQPRPALYAALLAERIS